MAYRSVLLGCSRAKKNKTKHITYGFVPFSFGHRSPVLVAVYLAIENKDYTPPASVTEVAMWQCISQRDMSGRDSAVSKLCL